MQKCAARGTGSKPNYLHPPPPWHGIWNGKLYWFIWNEILIIIKPPLPHKMWWNSKFPQVIETIVDRGLEIWETRQQKVEIKRGAKVIVPPPRVHCNTGHLRWQDIRADCVSKSVQKVALKGYKLILTTRPTDFVVILSPIWVYTEISLPDHLATSMLTMKSRWNRAQTPLKPKTCKKFNPRLRTPYSLPPKSDPPGWCTHKMPVARHLNQILKCNTGREIEYLRFRRCPKLW